MDIISLAFEEALVISIGNSKLKLYAFKTAEVGNIKFGVEAPRSIEVHREEIYESIQKRQLEHSS